MAGFNHSTCSINIDIAVLFLIVNHRLVTEVDNHLFNLNCKRIGLGNDIGSTGLCFVCCNEHTHNNESYIGIHSIDIFNNVSPVFVECFESINKCSGKSVKENIPCVKHLCHFNHCSDDVIANGSTLEEGSEFFFKLCGKRIVFKQVCHNPAEECTPVITSDAESDKVSIADSLTDFGNLCFDFFGLVVRNC